MIKRVSTVSVFVEDQDRAKDFYVNKLGFELRRDEPLFPGATVRWLAVAPAGSTTEIILYIPDDNWEHYKGVIGKAQSITLEVDDIRALYNDLTAKGVEFTAEPEEQPWGTFTFLIDSEGNRLLINQSSSNN